MPFSPVVDTDLLPQAPWQALNNGAARGIDLLVGHTRDEYRLFTAHLGREPTAKQVSAAITCLRGMADDG